jgi:hypothetical protein
MRKNAMNAMNNGAAWRRQQFLAHSVWGRFGVRARMGLVEDIDPHILGIHGIPGIHGT